MKKKLAILCGIVSFLLIFLVLSNHIAWFDDTIYHYVISLKREEVTILFLILSDIVYLLIGICILFWLLYKNRQVSFLVTLNLGFAFVLSYILKFIFRRQRPIGIALAIEHGYSMPSSHAMVSICFFGFLFYLVYKTFPKRKLKSFLLLFLPIYIFSIGISRIYLGVHYASDVLIGFCLGILYLVFFIKIFENKIECNSKNSKEDEKDI